MQLLLAVTRACFSLLTLPLEICLDPLFLFSSIPLPTPPLPQPLSTRLRSVLEIEWSLLEVRQPLYHWPTSPILLLFPLVIGSH